MIKLKQKLTSRIYYPEKLIEDDGCIFTLKNFTKLNVLFSGYRLFKKVKWIIPNQIIKDWGGNFVEAALVVYFIITINTTVFKNVFFALYIFEVSSIAVH
jgi:hypothetical protein